MQAMQGNGTPAAASPEAPFVPSVTIKKDVTQTLGANFWASAAGASYDSQRAATPPAAELPSTQPAAESPAVEGSRSPAGLPACPAPSSCGRSRKLLGGSKRWQSLSLSCRAAVQSAGARPRASPTLTKQAATPAVPCEARGLL